MCGQGKNEGDYYIGKILPNAGFVERETPHGKKHFSVSGGAVAKGTVRGKCGMGVQNGTARRATTVSDCRPFYWNCTPRPEAKTPHPSRLTPIHLPLSGEALRGATRFVLYRSKGGDVFRQLTFLLPLHALSCNRDTSSVSLPLDTFPSKGKACKCDAFGVQAPLRGRLANVNAFRLFSVLLHYRFFDTMENYRSKRFPLGRERLAVPPSSAAHSFARAPLRLSLAAPCPVLTTAHCPLLHCARRVACPSPPRVPLRPSSAAPLVRPRAASLIPRRPASRSDH